MDITEFKTALLSAEAPTEAFLEFGKENYSVILPDVKDILRKVSTAPETLKDNAILRGSLDKALMMVAINRDKSMFGQVFDLFRRRDLWKNYEETSWLVRDGHRILASTCDQDDISAIGDMAMDTDLPIMAREQALLVFHFVWYEKAVPENDLINEFRLMMEHKATGETEWKFWMALVINATLIGGAKLRPQIMAILDSGKVGEQSAFVRRIVTKLFTAGSGRFRELMKDQHKGYMTDMKELAADYATIPSDEAPDMPVKGKPQVREEPKVGRNDPCPCGSGLKYKKCCGKNL